MTNPFFTIGHSTRPTEAFVALLKAADVKLVVDVRTVPRSRTNPQFNRDVLPASLSAHGVAYQHLPELGGLAGPAARRIARRQRLLGERELPQFRRLRDERGFRSGLRNLRELGRAAPAAVMCAESLWWRCHRRIIADYLIAAGEEVFHILGPGHPEPAHLTPAARLGTDGTLTYPKDPPPVLDLWP